MAGVVAKADAEAQTPRPSATSVASTNAQDFSQGFRTFLRMGLPDTSKARYVRLDSADSALRNMGYFELSQARLSGNAWLITEDLEGKSVLALSSGRTMELYDEKTLIKKKQAEASKTAEKQATIVRRLSIDSDSRQSGSWSPADLSRDLARAISFLDKKLKDKTENASSSRYDPFLHGDDGVGTLFLFAVCAWQNGQVQDANALAGKLFALAGDSRKVIVSAINVMVDAQLSAATDAFKQSHDWKAYHTAVTGLLTRFPNGWRKAGGVKLLADRLQARIAITTPPPVKGDGLGDEDQKLAAALLTETHEDGFYFDSRRIWIFPRNKTRRDRGGSEGTETNAIARIQARGLQSVPLLIALASDETFCPICRNSFGSVHSFFDSDSESSAEALNATVYSELDRPLTRGEIARQLLEPLCRRDGDENRGVPALSPEEQIEAAKHAYETLKAIPQAELPQYFLKNGDREQQSEAVRQLLNSDVEANAAQIETFLLTPPPEASGYASLMGEGNDLVREYVEARGEKAADFVEKYAASRKTASIPESMANNTEFVKMAEKSAESKIKALRALVKKQDTSEAITAWANATDDDGEAARLAYRTLKRLPAEKSVPMLLAKAVETTNVAVRTRILRILPVVRYTGFDESAEAGELLSSENVAENLRKLAEKNRSNIGTNAAAWKTLLADEHVSLTPRQNPFGDDDPTMTIADLAATAMETLYGSELNECGMHLGYALEQLRPEAAMKLIRSRAAARLEGKTEDQLPKMPSADDVADDRRKAIEQSLLKASPDEVEKQLKQLTDSEMLCVVETLEQNEALKNALATSRRRIASIKVDPALPTADAAKLKQLEGKSVSSDVVTQMMSVCKSQLASGTAYLVRLSPSGPIGSLSLRASPVEAEARRSLSRDSQSYLRKLNKGKGRFGVMSGILASGQGYHQANWTVELPPTPANDNKATEAKAEATEDENGKSLNESFEETQKEFAEAMQAVFSDPDASNEQVNVMFFGSLPSGETSKSKDDDDDLPVDMEIE